jgi:hypothetical protein
MSRLYFEFLHQTASFIDVFLGIFVGGKERLSLGGGLRDAGQEGDLLLPMIRFPHCSILNIPINLNRI